MRYVTKFNLRRYFGYLFVLLKIDFKYSLISGKIKVLQIIKKQVK